MVVFGAYRRAVLKILSGPGAFFLCSFLIMVKTLFEEKNLVSLGWGRGSIEIFFWTNWEM